jgi:hypothetical protein
MPDHKNAGTLRGADDFPRNDTPESDTGPAGTVFDLPAAQKAKHPAQKPYPLIIEGTVIWIYPGRNLRQEDTSPDTEISEDPVLKFQLNFLLDRLEQDEADVEALKEQVLLQAAPFMAQIEILTSMKGVSVFIAIAIIADIIDVSRFRDSKAFTFC